MVNAICHRRSCAFIRSSQSLVIRHNKCQIVAAGKLLLKEHAGAAAAEPALGDDRYTITQDVSFIHEVR